MFMYLAVILLLTVAADANDVLCCKNNFFQQPAMNKTTECHQLAKPPPSCEYDTCLAKKLGLLNDDGTLDKKKVQEHYTKTYGIDPISNDAVVTNCINGDLSKYGKEDYCELLKFTICVKVQTIETCPEWSNEGECEGVEEKLKKKYL